ncbi:PAS domain-containing protein [Mucilaginibacter sp. E4BP6]|uniref:PAS domain-containing protein n=1 Tax=Mucilaginibacter sp. E4BP6 TaxID=2723089 RepID=UPI0015CBFF0C|nr:PAS domain-containing protein [Mucilaginibacter sp. E4BP6]NYE65502.1 PAS domain S-box-containing protein [Mucilaginibacter sp. E4BP6]
MKPDIKFLNTLLEIAHLEFQTYDVFNQKLIFSSGVAKRFLGYSEQEYLQLSEHYSQTIIHPDDIEKVQNTIEHILNAESGQIVEMTVRLRRSDGSFAWVYSRQMVYERNDNDHILTVIREVEDVSQMIALQQSLQEKVNQLKVISFKNSHLIRGPVATIIGLIELIEERPVSSQQSKEILEFLKDTISKLDGIIHEINDEASLR